MRPAGESEFGQDVSQDPQESSLFFIHRGKPVQTTSVPTKGFNDVQALEFFDDAPGRHLQPALANLTLQQAIGE